VVFCDVCRQAYMQETSACRSCGGKLRLLTEPTVSDEELPLDIGRRGPKGHLLTFNNETLTIREWAFKTGLRHDTIFTRLKRGWPLARALTEPEHPKSSDVSFERLRTLSVKLGEVDAEIRKLTRLKDKLQREFDTLSSQYKE
jgi:hypothetical protein